MKHTLTLLTAISMLSLSACNRDKDGTKSNGTGSGNGTSAKPTGSGDSTGGTGGTPGAPGHQPESGGRSNP